MRQQYGPGTTAAVLILLFATSNTVISTTKEHSDFTVERVQRKVDRRHVEILPNQRDLVKSLLPNRLRYKDFPASEQLSTSSHEFKVKRAAEQEQDQLAITIENSTAWNNQLSVAPEDSASASDVIRQLSENDYADEDLKWTDSSSREESQETLGGNRGEKGPAAKPTKYHYYPHNQHLYLLPECTTQQVCNLVYTRFNFSQPLCACPDRFHGPCSASINRNDKHTLEIAMKSKKSNRRNTMPATLIKTCEETKLIRECRSPADWAVLALQNVRTGKSQYLVICNCLKGELDGPMNHEQPTYARVPGIRVYGMMCNSVKVQNTSEARSWRKNDNDRTESNELNFPWEKLLEFASSIGWN